MSDESTSEDVPCRGVAREYKAVACESFSDNSSHGSLPSLEKDAC
jgi:hypothetical protein